MCESIYPMILNPRIIYPITECESVHECLRLSEEASHEVGQKLNITTFDLGVCMMHLPRTVQISHRHAWLIPCDMCILENTW